MGVFDFFGKKGETKDYNLVGSGQLRDMMEEIRNNIKQDFGGIPVEENEIDDFYVVLKRAVEKHLESQMSSGAGSVDMESLSVDALPLFHVSEDHMYAYVCVLPPLNEGEGIERDRFLEDMRYEGIVYGIDEEAVSRLISMQEYLHIIHIAAGTSPLDGKDGRLEELFQRRNEKTLELDDNASLERIDFRKHNKVQTIQEGEVICRIHAPVAAKDGMTVSGQVLYARGGEAVRIPKGKNTTISADGSVLTADISGVVVTEDDNFTVNDQKIVFHDVDASVGDLECMGDLFIRGNIDDGVTINAIGNIIIEGNVRHGKILSGGTIRIQGEVKGSRENELSAEKQIQCAILEEATATAKGNIYAEVIANSEVISREGSIYAVSGRGLIFGGSIQAYTSVFTKKIGNISGCKNLFTLGYNPKREERRDAVANELKEIDVLCERLRKDIAEMRAAGKNYQRDTKEEYARLVEQRSVYDDLAKRKTKELEELESILLSNVSGSIICEKIHPTTQVHIGGHKIVIQEEVTDCNIHLQGKQVVLK